MSLITLPPGSPGKFCWRVIKGITSIRGPELLRGQLGGEGRLEGDMGLGHDGQIGLS
jgi:hypothetical protein